MDAVASLLPSTYYMDQPDGGNVTVLEQVSRMAKDAEQYRLMRQNTATAIEIVPDWPFCNPGCDYEDPNGGMHDHRGAGCCCDAAKASIDRQRAAITATKE
jgi:hypothetical protein